jgi:uncharacterized membrane protein YfcA
MDFPISGEHLSPIYLVAVGFIVGLFGGFFGVGGSFLAGPGLFITGLPMNWVVGTDIAHIVGKSIVASREHLVRGNVDIKLALIMGAGTIAGTEGGAQAIQYLKQLPVMDKVVGVALIGVLLLISAFMAWESWTTINRTPPAVRRFPEKIHRFKLAPMINLAESGIEAISFWVILAVGLFAGFMAGFIGGGAGFLRMPLLVYALGVPTKVAIGTDLVEVAISASYGTLSHALKGNVDIMIALVMHTGAAVGAQIGVRLTDYFAGPKIRLAFSPLPLIGAALVVYGLVTGHPMK